MIARPSNLSAFETMAIGTAGYTAMLCVLALEKHWAEQYGATDGAEVLVTGASGGVGSVAIMLLAQKGYRVVASTGKLDETPYLVSLGATEVIDRATLAVPGKPLQKERWLGVIDSVGSHTLVNACASTKYLGAVASCGLAQGMDLPGSVAPFILRGVTLYGIDSVMAPLARRELAWSELTKRLNRSLLASIAQEIGLEDALSVGTKIVSGGIKGRVVVNVNH